MIDLTNKTYQNILEQMLALIPNTFDKRDTSPIQTALGPAAYALEEFYLNLNYVQKSAFISSAEGDDLDELAILGGVSRQPASAAVRMGVFNTTIPLGSRFSTINGSDSINFVCTGSYSRSLSVSINQSAWTSSPLGGSDGTFNFIYNDGWTYSDSLVALSTYGLTFTGAPVYGDTIVVSVSSGTASASITPSASRYTYELTAETAGTIGNDYSGAILPISVIPNLNSALLGDILVLGDDEEEDSSLRSRLIESLTDRPFGGNVSQYRQEVLEMDGVGGVQVYPTWDGGGTVKLSIVGTDHLPASASVISAVQAAVDPQSEGEGLGIAPIGAVVTVSAPTAVAVNVAATVTLASGYSLGQVTPLIEEAISSYLDSIRKAWDTQLGTYEVSYSADVYYARILAAILSVTGVLNVPTLTLNGGTLDLQLTETGALQQIPVEGTVSISE